MYSIEIERFIKFIKQCQSDYKFHYENVGKRDKDKGDLEHQLELGSAKERGKTTTKIVKVLKERRTSKDMVELTEPIAKFADENKKTIDQLTQVLGQIRKVEKYHGDRSYKPRIRTDLTI
jgi:hypothetical protein